MTMITVDIARGVDVFRGKTLLQHFEGASAYEEARAYAAQGRGRYIRYWQMKVEG